MDSRLRIGTGWLKFISGTLLYLYVIYLYPILCSIELNDNAIIDTRYVRDCVSDVILLSAYACGILMVLVGMFVVMDRVKRNNYRDLMRAKEKARRSISMVKSLFSMAFAVICALITNKTLDFIHYTDIDQMFSKMLTLGIVVTGSITIIRQLVFNAMDKGIKENKQADISEQEE